MNVDRRKVMGGLLAAGCAPAGARAGGPLAQGHARLPGGRVWWKKVGAGRKPPLLTLHGGPGGGHDYLLPLRALANARPVIVYDQLGCGRADSPTDEKIYTIQRSVDEVDGLRRALARDRVVLFG